MSVCNVHNVVPSALGSASVLVLERVPPSHAFEHCEKLVHLLVLHVVVVVPQAWVLHERLTCQLRPFLAGTSNCGSIGHALPPWRPSCSMYTLPGNLPPPQGASQSCSGEWE